MFGSLRKLSDGITRALERVATLLEAVLDQLEQRSPDTLEERVAGLELARAKWEAEVEGVLLKAQGERRAARAAEERTRHAARRASEDDEEGMDDLPDEYVQAVRAGNGGGSQAEGVPAMPPRVGLSRTEQKALATRMKFGG